MRAGSVPYRDFAARVPAGRAAGVRLPSLADAVERPAGYRRGFRRMCRLGGLLPRSCCSSCSRLEAGPWWSVGARSPLSPLLLGSVVLSRYDLWPAALPSARSRRSLAGRHRLGWALLGAAAAAKLYPRVVVPVASSGRCGARGRREAATASAAFARGGARAASRRSSSSRRAGCGTRRRQLEPAAADRELGAGVLLAPTVRAASDHCGQPRLAEHRRPRRPAALARSAVVQRPCWSRSGSGSRAAPPTASASSATRPPPSRVRRVRQGAVAAVPDLARAAGRRSSHGRRGIAAVGLLVAALVADAGLVPGPLLGPRARLRPRVGRAAAELAAGRAPRGVLGLREHDGTRTASHDVARPSGRRTRRARPRCARRRSAGSSRTGRPVRKRRIAASARRR